MLTGTEIGIRGKTTFFPTTLAFLTWAIAAMADEPGWTDQERLETRDMVCLGTVVSTEKVGRIGEHADLYLAVVEITGMKKGKKISTGSKINVYYELSAKGRGNRCPTYAELAKGEKATFYLNNMSEANKASMKITTVKEPALFLAMGSDVQKIVEILKINESRTNSVSISAGSGDGAAVGDVFSVYREKAPIGRLKITQVKQDQSTATITALQGVAKLEPGDVAVEDGAFRFLEGLRFDSAVEAPAQSGRMYADADIRRGLTRILYAGKPWSQGKPFIDDNTGYAVVITEGCIVSTNFVLFVDEYNLAMKEHSQETANAPQAGKK